MRLCGISLTVWKKPFLLERAGNPQNLQYDEPSFDQGAADRVAGCQGQSSCVFLFHYMQLDFGSHDSSHLNNFLTDFNNILKLLLIMVAMVYWKLVLQNIFVMLNKSFDFSL